MVTEWKSNMSQSFLVNMREPLSQSIQSAFIIYNKAWSFIYQKYWVFDKITVFLGIRQESAELCPIQSFFENSEVTEYSKCI